MMKRKKFFAKYTWKENSTLFYHIEEKAKGGNPLAAGLVDKLRPKYKTKVMVEKYKMYRLVQLHNQSSQGSIRAWQRLDRIRRYKKQWDYWEKMVAILGVDWAKSLMRKRKTPFKPDIYWTGEFT
jgi:hypothetical protein